MVLPVLLAKKLSSIKILDVCYAVTMNCNFNYSKSQNVLSGYLYILAPQVLDSPIEVFAAKILKA